MYLIVELQVGLDIENCITFYTNFEDNLLARLHRDFDMICLNGFLILSVLDIVKAGECVFNNVTRPTRGSLSVIFRAYVVSYRPGDILVGSVVRPEQHERITMISQHANAMIIQTKESQSASVLAAGAIAIISVIEIYAPPGQSRVAINTNLYEPRKITYYYPIIPGTIENMNSDNALTCAKYADIARIRELLERGASYEFPISESLDAGLTVMSAAQKTYDFFEESMKDIKTEQQAIPGIVRQLFYSYIDGNQKKHGNSSVQPHKLLQLRDLPNDATCVVVCDEFHPFDGVIGTCSATPSEYPSDWVQGEVAQPAGVIIARRLERFIDYLIAGEAMAREFMDPNKILATKSLIVLQTKNKQ